MQRLELTERVIRLRNVPTLAALPPAELAQVAQALRTRTFQAGDMLTREDEPPRAFFLLTSGTVSMRRKGQRVGTITAPGGVGFLSMLARTAGGTACVAETYTEAYEVRVEVMDDIFEDNFQVLLATIRWVAERLIAENRQQRRPPPYMPPTDGLHKLIGERELGVIEKILLVRRMRAFTEANVNSLASLAQRMVERRVPAGEVLWRPDEPSDRSFFIVRGMCDITWNDGQVRQEVGPGYVLGGAESLCAYPRWNTLTSREPAILLVGNREALIEAFEDDFELAMRFLSALSTLLMGFGDRKAEAGSSSVGPPAP